MKNFVVALNERMPEAKKAHKSMFDVKAVSKFHAIVKAYRIAKTSHGRIDGAQPIIEGFRYCVQIG